jgi:adenylate cyclase
MHRKWVQGLLIGLLAAAAAAALWRSGSLDRLEFVSWAWRVRTFAARTPPSDRIRLVLLDQASLDWGRRENAWSWPWPREVYAAVLDFCRRAGARAVAFDVLYTEPSVYGVADDQALGSAIAASPPFIGALFLGATGGEATNWPAGVSWRFPAIEGSSTAVDGVRRTATFPIPEVATNAAGLANVSDDPDADGVFRRAALFRVFDGSAVPSMGLGAFLAGSPALAPAFEPGRLRLGDRSIPVDRSGRLLLRFAGRDGRHEAVSASAVIRSALQLQAGEKPLVDPEEFRDAYVLFGFSAPGLYDLRPTPVSRVYPGVEIHATVLDNLLTARCLADAPPLASGLAAAVLGLLAALAAAHARRAGQTVAAFLVFLPLPALVGWLAYAQGFWWPVAQGQAAVALALVGAVIVNYATEGRQKAFIKQAFRHYLSPAVIDRILANPAQLTLGGERRELSMLFSDIEKFSSFSERLEPQALTALLNDYLSDMTAIILDEGGTLDKYIGDAIVAFWNAPAAQPDHAERACRAALRCHRKLAARRDDFARLAGAVLHTRIGLNTGEVVVGNMGSNDRFAYTMFGDAANLASRLEGANKAFGTYLLVAESTWRGCEGRFIGRELAVLRVIGRRTPVRVFELTGLADEEPPPWMADFGKGLRLFTEGRFADAVAVFGAIAEADPAARAYAARCREYVAHPPAAWDGVWELTEK